MAATAINLRTVFISMASFYLVLVVGRYTPATSRGGEVGNERPVIETRFGQVNALPGSNDAARTPAALHERIDRLIDSVGWKIDRRLRVER